MTTSCFSGGNGWPRLMGPALLAALVLGDARQSDAQLVDIVREEVGLTDSDLETLDRGEPVIVLPKVDDNQDVFVFGAIRLAVPVDFMVARARDIEGVFTESDIVKSFGRMTVGASSSGWLDLPKGDIDAMSKCRPEKCDVKLSAQLIERMAREIDWSGPDRTRQANGFMERVLQDYLDTYAQRGASALMTYNDKKDPLSVAEGIRYLLSQAKIAQKEVPRFHQYLAAYPEGGDKVLEDFFYWSLEDFGLKPTLFVHHVVIATDRDESPTRALLGTVQIYANHFFQTAIDLMLFASVSENDPAASTYVLFISRGRFDGKVGGIKRNLLTGDLRKKSRSSLAATKERLEREYGRSE